MSVLFAESILPDYFMSMVIALVIVYLIAIVLFATSWVVIDKITPGKLNEEIVPTTDKKPNLALAVVVAAMVIGFAMILGMTILGIMLH